MHLDEIVAAANALVEAGEYESCEAILRVGAGELQATTDVSLLEDFAKLCHDWGSEDNEALVLRRLLLLTPTPSMEYSELAQRLMDVLLAGMETQEGVEKLSLYEECIQMASSAMEGVEHKTSLNWGNLLHAKAVCHLELARLGRKREAAAAVNLLKKYREWLAAEGMKIAQLEVETLRALAGIDLAEANILGGNGLVVSLLEDSIERLESTQSLNWMIPRAYQLLEQVS